ncbi:hypothetical protein [Halorubrum sp. N11]|uniref:hypothetical protein n=1 Tax=Halorubrum sp. N11 TaxID=3402276 RepID=UPI003EB9CE03
MNRRIALIAVAVALVGVAGIAAASPIGTAVAQDDPVATNETDAGNETVHETDISPGERLSGVIGVQRAEISGEVDSRAFEIGLNQTETPEQRADLVAERLNRTEDRLTEIERRQRELRERRDAGELSQGAFAARMAETSARAEAVKREANRSADVAGDLPESVRADRGLTEERLGELRQRAGNASGPEVAAIARGVAGNDVGGPLASDRRGPPAGAGTGGGAGAGPHTGNGTEADRPGGGDGSHGDGPSDHTTGMDTDGDSMNATRDSTNATRGSTNATRGSTNVIGGPADDAGNTTDAGDDGGQGDGSDGANATLPRDDSGDGPRAGNGNGPGSARTVVNAADGVTERLDGPLTDGADFVRRVVGIER